LEKLQDDFRKQKQEIDKIEVESVAKYDAFMQEKSDYVRAKNEDLDESKKMRSETIESIASASE